MKKNSIFWIGYSDLMTSLFFIMLVLFVIPFGYLKSKEKGLIKDIERLKKILRLEEQFAPLEKDSDFIYLKACKKFIVKDLMGVEIFEPEETIIKKQYIQPTINAGKKIENFLKKLQKENPDLSYLLIIEGNMANKWDKSLNKDSRWGYITSYQRALAVYELWQKNGITFRKYNVEVMLCGSGFNGLCRDDVEDNNKRFSIQIIPKTENKK